MVNVDRSRSGLLSDVIQAANKRLGTDNLFAVMGTPIRIGFLHPSPDPKIGNDLDIIFRSEDPEECIEFIKAYRWPPEFAPEGHEGPRIELYGRMIVATDWDGNELHRGTLTEINIPFEYKIGDEWWTFGESYNCDFTQSPLKIWGAWKC